MADGPSEAQSPRPANSLPSPDSAPQHPVKIAPSPLSATQLSPPPFDPADTTGNPEIDASLAEIAQDPMVKLGRAVWQSRHQLPEPLRQDLEEASGVAQPKPPKGAAPELGGPPLEEKQSRTISREQMEALNQLGIPENQWPAFADEADELITETTKRQQNRSLSLG